VFALEFEENARAADLAASPNRHDLEYITLLLKRHFRLPLAQARRPVGHVDHMCRSSAALHLPTFLIIEIN
jgi:hypothetical protein